MLAVQADGPAVVKEKEKGKFRVSTWECSRSFREVFASDNLNEIHMEVLKAQKEESNFRVSLGELPWGHVFGGKKNACTYQAYVRFRVGWQCVDETDTEAKAKATIDKHPGCGSFLIVSVAKAVPSAVK